MGIVDDADNVLEHHRSETLYRCLHQDKVLVIQGSTTLNLKTKKSTKGLKSIRRKGAGSCAISPLDCIIVL